MGKITYILWLLAISVIVTITIGGCSSSACLDNKSAITLAGFYDMSTRRAISVDSLQIGGVDAPDDSLLVDITRVSEVYLPMRAAYNTTSFYIHYAQKVFCDPRFNDTLTFEYTAKPYFASEECGAMYVYQIHKFDYTRHLIDSIGIVDSLITNANKQYLHVFFRTATGEGRGL